MKFLILFTLISTSVFAHSYGPQESRTISASLLKVFSAATVDGTKMIINPGKVILGVSENGLPCILSAHAYAESTQIDVIEAKSVSDLHVNGIPFMSIGQFKWEAYNSYYKKQNLNDFSDRNGVLDLDFEFRDFSGPMGHTGDASLSVQYGNDGVESVHIKEHVGFFGPKNRELTCSGPWSKF